MTRSLRVEKKCFIVRYDDRLLREKVREGFDSVAPKILSEDFSDLSIHHLSDNASLIHFGECISSERVVDCFKKRGLWPGLPTDLVDLAKSCPSASLDKCFPIVALGDPRNVLCLNGPCDVSYRALHMGLWRSIWGDYWWFLAFASQRQNLVSHLG